MTKGSGAPPSPDKSAFWPEWLTPRRLWDFVTNVYHLEQTVVGLKADNAALKQEIGQLREEQIGQAARMDLLIRFVEHSLAERIELRTETMVLRLLQERRQAEPPRTE